MFVLVLFVFSFCVIQFSLHTQGVLETVVEIVIVSIVSLYALIDSCEFISLNEILLVHSSLSERSDNIPFCHFRSKQWNVFRLNLMLHVLRLFFMAILNCSLRVIYFTSNISLICFIWFSPSCQIMWNIEIIWTFICTTVKIWGFFWFFL